MFFIYFPVGSESKVFIGYDDAFRPNVGQAKVMDQKTAEAELKRWANSAREHGYGTGVICRACDAPRYGLAVGTDYNLMVKQVNMLEKAGYVPIGGIAYDAVRQYIQAVEYRPDPLDEL